MDVRHAGQLDVSLVNGVDEDGEPVEYVRLRVHDAANGRLMSEVFCLATEFGRAVIGRGMKEHDVEVCNEECPHPCTVRYEKSLVTLEEEATWWVGCGQFVVAGAIYTLLTEVGHEAICPVCGTRVGIDKDGPWRERTVSEITGRLFSVRLTRRRDA